MLVNTCEILRCRYIHFHFRDKTQITTFHVVLYVNVVTPMYFLFLTSSNSWLNLQTNIVKMHSFRRSWQRRNVSNEDEHRHSKLSLFSRIRTSPLNEIICPKIWQNLNFAPSVLTSFRRRGQQTRLSTHCFKRAGNNSNERKFAEAREPHAHPCSWIACSIYRNNCLFQVNERT
jgi:hypothetical protein